MTVTYGGFLATGGPGSLTCRAGGPVVGLLVQRTNTFRIFAMPPMSLDDLIAAIKEVLGRRFPHADWAALVVHQPETPDAMIPVILSLPETRSDPLPHHV